MSLVLQLQLHKQHYGNETLITDQTCADANCHKNMISASLVIEEGGAWAINGNACASSRMLSLTVYGMKLSSCSCGQGAAHRRVDGPNSLSSPEANLSERRSQGTRNI